MNSERIKEIQEKTGLIGSVSVMQALNQVWNECEQEPSVPVSEIEVIIASNGLDSLDMIEEIVALIDKAKGGE